jgi:hypothetical protein
MKNTQKNKRQYAKSKMVEHTPVLPEWYRTTHAMKVLNLSRADVSLASDVPGNILSRFLNGNSHLPTHLDRLRNWLSHLNSNNVMTEQESIEMAKVKKLTALDIVPKTVRKRKRRSRRNIGRVGIQESFRQRQQVGLTRTQEQEEQILLRRLRRFRFLTVFGTISNAVNFFTFAISIDSCSVITLFEFKWLNQFLKRSKCVGK